MKQQVIHNFNTEPLRRLEQSQAAYPIHKIPYDK